jgi:hypothetical protein
MFTYTIVNMKFYATSPTPQVSAEFDLVAPTRTLSDGQVYFSFKNPLSSSDRGILLLDLELFLKENIDSGIVIWCEPIGDKNSLRNLRGIEIIS